MQQYLELLKAIKDRGTLKPAAREGMPSSLSLFGYQFRHDLSKGFPLLTTKKVSFKNIVTELLWFLRGDTNIKYLVDNGCNIWNEDAYNYYLKIYKQCGGKQPVAFEYFLQQVKLGLGGFVYPGISYTYGDCGYQYGKVWRKWQGEVDYTGERSEDGRGVFPQIDQIVKVINSLKEKPESRRHIITAIDPAHDEDLALYWCHALVQFNCRPLNNWQQLTWLEKNGDFRNKETMKEGDVPIVSEWSGTTYFAQQSDLDKMPKYYLDCQMYQRSADVFLGVPYNIASYALLTHILCKIVNMVPGEFVHTFGDVHIYENHMDAVEEQLSREPRELPTLKIKGELDFTAPSFGFDRLLKEDFTLDNYNPHPAIKAELSTGLKK